MTEISAINQRFSRRWRRIFLFAAFSALAILIYVNLSPLNESHHQTEVPIELLPTENVNCSLPNLDPFDARIQHFFNPQHNPSLKCRAQYKERSFPKPNGVIEIEWRPLENCNYQCFYAINDLEYRKGEKIAYRWDKENHFDCDFVEVECYWLYFFRSYSVLHYWVSEKSENFSSNDILLGIPQREALDVHIVLLDSVSMSQALRSVPKTVEYLREEWKAVPFRFLNKIGINSRPNAFGLLMGDLVEEMPPSPWGNGKAVDEVPQCSEPLDNTSFILFDYQRRGYRTMMNEDWPLGMFDWPFCAGFQKLAADHLMRPFASRFVEMFGRMMVIDRATFDRMCRQPHEYALDAILDFASKYPKNPKISLTWLSYPAHDLTSGLYPLDVQFREFFQKLNSLSENSFIIFMSDHGNRLDKIRATRVGEIEDNNPFLFVGVPKRLHKNADLLNQLEQNSQQLVTHFDIYSTLLEISTNGYLWNEKTTFSSTEFRPKDGKKLRGSSLLHSLPKPRDCDSLSIPFQYCICQLKQKTQTDGKLAIRIAKMSVRKMNKALAESEFHSSCHPLSVDIHYTKNKEVIFFEELNNRRMVKIQFRVLPSGGLYSASAHLNGSSISLISSSFPRLDSYDAQSACIREDFLKNYCYCRWSTLFWFWKNG